MFTGAVPQHTVATSQATFESLGLGRETIAILGELGFERPTPIQAEAIPPALAGRDVIGLAETGSGKTAAFALPMLERLHGRSGVRGLVLCPTREIALQTEAFFRAAGKGRGLKVACLIGGVKFGPQIAALKGDADVVVATPGRLWDHFQRRNLRLDRVEVLVLDEGDHMLDLGFLPQIHRVLEQVPKDRQLMIFSATLPAAIERIVKRYAADPQTVDLRPRGKAARGIEHRLYLVEPDDMRACLMALVAEEEGSMLVFLRRKVDAEWACKAIEKEGHPVERIHGDRSQRQRVEALEGLREGEHRVLVATDVAARGIDLPIVGHVVNFGLPETAEDYVHRAGRTARGALEGIVSTIASWMDMEAVRSVERTLGEKLPRCTAPGVAPLKERKRTIQGRKRLRRRLL